MVNAVLKIVCCWCLVAVTEVNSFFWPDISGIFTPEEPGCYCPELVTFTKLERTGIIKSPINMNTSRYCRSLNCKWRIKPGEPNYGISLKFDWFVTEFHHDYLDLFYILGTERRKLARMTGYMPMEDIPRLTFGSNSSLELYFHTDSSGIQNRGFEAVFKRFKLSESNCTCPQIYYNITSNEDKVEIQSPGYPSPHCHQLQCYYFIRAEKNHDVLLEFQDVDLEEFDYVKVFDGNTTEKLIAWVSGEEKKTVRSTVNEMLLIFKSDGEVSHKGFRATARQETQVCKCPDKVFAGTSGIAMSPGFEHNFFCRGMNCTYNIQVPEKHAVQLEFSVLQLDLFDSLMVYPSGFNRSRYPLISWHDYYKIRKEKKLKFTSHTNTMKLKFLTEARRHYKFRRGFNVTYTAIPRQKSCGCPSPQPQTLQDIKGTVGVNASCGPMDCFIVLDQKLAGNNHLFKFTIEELNLNYGDYLKIYRGHFRTWFPAYLLKIFKEPTAKPKPDFISIHEAPLMIHFHSDSTKPNGKVGFSMKYSWSQQECDCGEGELNATVAENHLVSPGYPGPYCNQLMCKWIIQAETGQRVVLKINDLRVEHGADNIAIFDCPLNKTETNRIDRKPVIVLTGIAENYGSEGIRSSGSVMTLIFETDTYGEERGFNFTYFSESQSLPIPSPAPPTTKKPATSPLPTTAKPSPSTISMSASESPTELKLSSTNQPLSIFESPRPPSSLTDDDGVSGELKGERESEGISPWLVLITISLIVVSIALVVYALVQMRNKGYLTTSFVSTRIRFSRYPDSTTTIENHMYGGGGGTGGGHM